MTCENEYVCVYVYNQECMCIPLVKGHGCVCDQNLWYKVDWTSVLLNCSYTVVIRCGSVVHLLKVDICSYISVQIHTNCGIPCL